MNAVIEASAPATAGAIFRRVLANAGKLLGGRSISAVLSLAYTALAARTLGVHDLGTLVMINAFAQFLGDAVKFQSWQTVLQYGVEPLAQGRLEELQRVLRFTVMLDVGSGAVGVLIGVTGAFLLGPRLGWTPAQAPLAAAYALSVAVMASAAPIGVLRLLDRFDALAAQGVVTAGVRVAGCAIGYLLHAKLPFFLGAWAAGTVAGFGLLGFASWRELRTRRLLADFRWLGSTRVQAPGVWRFAWATNFNATLEVAFTHLVTLLVGGLIGPSEAALWRVGRQVADALARPVRLLTPALYPELARLRAEGREATMWRLMRKIALVATGLGLLLLGISLFAGAPLLRLVMGAAFASAAGIMTWQVAAAVVDLISLPLEPMVISLGKAGATVRVRVVVALLYIALLPWMIHLYGLTAAGAGLVAASAAIALGMFWLLLRQRPRAGV